MCFGLPIFDPYSSCPTTLILVAQSNSNSNIIPVAGQPAGYGKYNTTSGPSGSSDVKQMIWHVQLGPSMAIYVLAFNGLKVIGTVFSLRPGDLIRR